MKQQNQFACILSGMFLFLTVFFTSCSTEENKQTDQAAKPVMSLEEMEKRGKYLSIIGGCNDCHSPKILTAQGPVVDTTRILSGAPSDIVLPPINEKEVEPGKWYQGSSDMTAWVGPWGISFASNLTPDSATGSGTWTEELFFKMMRTGKFMGMDAGRPIMPPMPWESVGAMTDEDLKCLFAYLKSVPAIVNAVPDYVPPPEVKNYGKKM